MNQAIIGLSGRIVEITQMRRRFGYGLTLNQAVDRCDYLRDELRMVDVCGNTSYQHLPGTRATAEGRLRCADG